jgi:hypothetical protein
MRLASDLPISGTQQTSNHIASVHADPLSNLVR